MSTGAGEDTTRRADESAAQRVGGWIGAHAPIFSAACVVLLVVLMAVLGYRQARHAGFAPDDRAEMARADSVIDSLRTLAWHDEVVPAGAPLTLTNEGLIALGYVARAELGVGSPFRIASFAMRDTRVPASLGRAAAWAVLARVARGAAYDVDTMALVAVRGPVSTAAQWSAIDDAVTRASDARTGESAVRLGYALAASEGTVNAAAANAALRVAAQLRDRRLAVEDARRLLRASSANREADALSLLPQWRAERRFLVEQPLLGTALRVRDAEAARSAVVFRDVLRGLASAAQRAAPDSLGPSLGTPLGVPLGIPSTLLPPRAARRLAELPTVRGGPPQAPVAVATAALRRQLKAVVADSAPDGAALLAARQRFADRARSEESLVAELAVARDARGLVSPDVARIALVAAVSMRAFAQDTLSPFAGSAPTPDALRARFGLRAVTFDRSVPTSWRPYYLAQLSGALDDLQSVLPWLDLGGLAVRVGESVKRDSALALHDPGTRTVFLPAATGAGTIAHELAHDLDWQTARSRLAVRGAYSTDRAVRDGGSRIAISVRGLAAARPGSGPRAAASDERPAELFARGVDWYVATALAAAGRSDGALSAVQDEVLAGYAGVVPPEPGDGAAEALVEVLGDMTIVPVASRTSFLERYGADGVRTPAPAALLRAVATATSRGNADRVLRQLELIGTACVDAVEPRDVTEANWRPMLLRAAAESRARGFLRARGRWVSPTRWSWEARASTGGPWSAAVADSGIARMRDGLLRAVAADDALRHPFGDAMLAPLTSSRCR